MIVKERDGGLLCVRQTDHALLSGAFAAAWGNERFPVPERRDSVLVAASRHDDGWAQWELAPRVQPEGDPVDFIRIPVDEHVQLYRRGIDLVQAEDAYAGLIASMHGERLYTRPFHPGMDPRIEHLAGRDLDLAHAYVEGEQRRQHELRAETRADDADVEEAWRLLQVWDRLSLVVCMGLLDTADEQTMPLVRTGEGSDVRIVCRATDPATLTLDPYPFRDAPVAFELASLHIRGRSWPDDAAFRLAYRTASPQVVRFSCRPV